MLGAWRAQDWDRRSFSREHIRSSDNLLKSRDAALDWRRSSYDIVNHIRPIQADAGVTI